MKIAKIWRKWNGMKRSWSTDSSGKKRKPSSLMILIFGWFRLSSKRLFCPKSQVEFQVEWEFTFYLGGNNAILNFSSEFIEKGWDPLSSSQTLRLVNLLRRLIRDYPSLKPTSKYMRALFNGILDKMKFSLDNDVFIPIFPKQFVLFLENSIWLWNSSINHFCLIVFRLQEAKSSFFQRQFSSALKLFRNLLSWEGILSDSALKEIAILSLLNRYLLSAIRVCITHTIFYSIE